MNIEPPAKGPPALPPADVGFFLDPGFDACEATAEVIALLLQKFPRLDRWCVEFGAGADSHGSSTNRLIVTAGYSAILIEGVKERCEFHRKLYKENQNVLVFEKFVGFHASDDNILDRILAKTPVPADFDFLSIDIDGNDYHVWSAITRYRPKLIMIEFNPTIPPEIKYVQPADARISFGNSLAALVDLGKSKQYELVCVFGTNALFVRRDDYPMFGIRDNSVQALWTKRDCVTYIFSGYDGRIVLGGCKKLPWHCDLPIQESKMQTLPRFLQKYPFTHKDYRLFQLLNTPWVLARIILKKFLFGSGRRDPGHHN